MRTKLRTKLMCPKSSKYGDQSTRLWVRDGRIGQQADQLSGVLLCQEHGKLTVNLVETENPAKLTAKVGTKLGP